MVLVLVLESLMAMEHFGLEKDLAYGRFSTMGRREL